MPRPICPGRDIGHRRPAIDGDDPGMEELRPWRMDARKEGSLRYRSSRMPPGFMKAKSAPTYARLASAMRSPRVLSSAGVVSRVMSWAASPTTLLATGATRSLYSATSTAVLGSGWTSFW